MGKIFQKIPRRILILCPNLEYYPTISSEIDFHPRDIQYDLVVVVNKVFRLSIDYPLSIAEAEIWFERGSALTKRIFMNALDHYSNCEIRNGA